MGIFGGSGTKKQLKETNINAVISTKKQKKQKVDKEKEKILKYVQDTIPYESVFDDGNFVNKYGEYSKVFCYNALSGKTSQNGKSFNKWC